MSLENLYQEMADMTSPVCENECTIYRDKKYRCCELKYCKLAAKFAKEKYNIELQPTGNPDLLFMSENGCTVPPHLRPICTLHVCPISYAGVSCIGSSKLRTDEYFALRKKIEVEAKIQNKIPEYE
jgi:hypothetical protein